MNMTEEKKNTPVKAQSTNSQPFQSALAKTQTAYTEMVVEAGLKINIQYSEYQKLCVANLLTKMKELLDKEGLDIKQINQTNITSILQTAAMLNLNAAASPRECYVITRNVKTANGWSKEFEFGIEGDGNDKILRKYGAGVKQVYPIWQVREGDEFTYPAFKGINLDPPSWTPKSMTGKVVRVVYPIRYEDDQIQYHISERDEVKVNLQAHISNNLLKSKDYTESKKTEIIDRLKDMTLDQIFEDSDALKIMSPAWRAPHSREAMILRKMRNNAIKKIPKDFSDAFMAKAYESTFEDYDQYRDDRIDKEGAVDAEVAEQAGSRPVQDDIPAIPQQVESVQKAPEIIRSEAEKVTVSADPF